MTTTVTTKIAQRVYDTLNDQDRDAFTALCADDSPAHSGDKGFSGPRRGLTRTAQWPATVKSPANGGDGMSPDESKTDTAYETALNEHYGVTGSRRRHSRRPRSRRERRRRALSGGYRVVRRVPHPRARGHPRSRRPCRDQSPLASSTSGAGSVVRPAPSLPSTVAMSLESILSKSIAGSDALY